MTPHETLEKIAILRSLDAKVIAVLGRRCISAPRPRQGVAA